MMFEDITRDGNGTFPFCFSQDLGIYKETYI